MLQYYSQRNPENQAPPRFFTRFETDLSPKRRLFSGKTDQNHAFSFRNSGKTLIAVHIPPL